MKTKPHKVFGRLKRVPFASIVNLAQKQPLLILSPYQETEHSPVKET